MGRRWLVAVGAVLVVVWLSVFNALWSVTTNAFDLSRWKWWLLSVAVGLTVVAAAVAGWRQIRSESAPTGRVWRVPTPDPGAVERTDLAEQLIRALTSQVPGPVGFTTILYGAGGFGKTTLARQVCWSRPVRTRFRDAVWVTIGEKLTRAELLDKIDGVHRELSGRPVDTNDVELAGLRLGELLDARRDVLLVIDDVWHFADLRPFLQGGNSSCTRLVTTRRLNVLQDPTSHQSVRVDQFSVEQARAAVAAGLGDLGATEIDSLVRCTGRWPLLVRLTNRRLAADIRAGVARRTAVARLVEQLRSDGPAILDVGDTASRDRAAGASIKASMHVLTATEQEFFLRLGIFGEDIDIPREVLVSWWAVAGGLSAGQVDRLCERLDGLSLVADYDRRDRSIRVHDIVRAYLRNQLGDRLAATHRSLIEAARPPAGDADSSTPWWLLPDHDEYLWQHLSMHLAGAGLGAELTATVCDLRWVEAVLRRSGPLAVIADLSYSSDPLAATLSRAVQQSAHLLDPIEPRSALQDTLISRLDGYQELRSLIDRYRAGLPTVPRLTNRWPLPDQPHPALRHTLTGHTDQIWKCAITPDGSLALTSGDDGTARIWDMATGALRHTLTGHAGSVRCAMDADGSLALTVDDEGKARIWELANGTLRCTLPANAASPWTGAIAPDGSFVLTGQSDGTARIWDVATGMARYTLAGNAEKCAIAPDGSLVLTAGRDGVTRVWEVATGRLRHTLVGPADSVELFGISQDGAIALTGSGDGTARIWDTVTGAQRQVLTGHVGAVWTGAIAPDGTYVLTAGMDGTVRIWDTSSGIERHALTGHADPIWDCAIAPDGTFAVTVGGDATARIWDTATGAQRQILTGHTGPVWSCAIAPDGGFVLTTAYDTTARVWEAQSNQAHLGPILDHSRTNAVAVSADGSFALTSSRDGQVRITDMATNAVRHMLAGHTGRVNAVAVAPDGSFVLTGSDDRTVRIWDSATGDLRHTMTRHTGWLNAVAVSPNCSFVLSGSDDRTAVIWDADTGAALHELTEHSGRVNAVAIGPDNSFVVTADDEGFVRIWDAATGGLRHTLTDHTASVMVVEIAADGSFIVTAGDDGTARIWEVATGALRHTLVGGPARVRACAIAGDGTLLLTAANDGTARIWDVGTGALRHTLTGHDGPVRAVVLTPDGRFGLTAGGDGTARIWDTSDGSPTAAIRVTAGLHFAGWLPDATGCYLAGVAGSYLFTFAAGDARTLLRIGGAGDAGAGA